MAVTIEDIAKGAGVSYSTVSRALNGIGAEDTESRENTLRLAQEMGYVSNQIAINLRKSRSYVIGLYFSAIDKMASPFVFHDVLTGVYSVAGSKYNVVVKGIDMHESGILNPSYFDGIIVLSQRGEDMESMNEILDKKIPTSVICRAVDVDALNMTTDEAPAMKRAMDYLLENGHRNIGIIKGNPGSNLSRLHRREWRASMTSHGLDPNALPVISSDYQYASGYTVAKQLLILRPTALLCLNGEMASGARTVIVEVGLKVPNDVSFAGFDNWDMSDYSDIHLTTVEHNMGEIAREGVRVLLRRLNEGIADNRRIYLNNKLIIRNTVKNLNVEERKPL